LKFGWNFNQPIEKLDLKNIKELKFEENFNQPIEKLDLKNIKELKFGWNFNQPIEKLDLKNVQTLTFGKSFQKPTYELRNKHANVRFWFDSNYMLFDLTISNTIAFGSECIECTNRDIKYEL
jgi:hypothetical protein